MTPGEMLAKKLSGDTSISTDDIEKATVGFFTAAGCNCKMEKYNSSNISATTGRRVSMDPNIQNIPIRTDAGQQIRKAFLTPDSVED